MSFDTIVAVTLGMARDSKALDAGATRPTAPAAARPHPLKGVAAIVELDIVSANYLYDGVLGPRTQFDVANVVIHAGTVTSFKSLTQFGGPLPDGSMVGAAGLPVLNPGSRYILFLGADPWFYTPVWSYLAFRSEKIGTRSVVVGPNGAAVTGISAAGVSFGRSAIVDLSGPNDPLTPRPALAGLSDTDPGVAEAIDSTSFVKAAVSAATQVGAQFGVAPPLSAALLGGASKWNVINGTPAPTP